MDNSKNNKHSYFINKYNAGKSIFPISSAESYIRDTHIKPKSNSIVNSFSSKVSDNDNISKINRNDPKNLGNVSLNFKYGSKNNNNVKDNIKHNSRLKSGSNQNKNGNSNLQKSHKDEIESQRKNYFNNKNTKMENPSVNANINKDGEINQEYAYNCYLEFLQKNPDLDIEYDTYFSNVFKQKEIEEKAKNLNLKKEEKDDEFMDYDMLSELAKKSSHSIKNDKDYEIKKFQDLEKKMNLENKIYNDLLNKDNFFNINKADFFQEIDDDDILYSYELKNNHNHYNINNNIHNRNNYNNNIDQEELDVIDDLMFMNIADPINEYEQGVINEIYPDIDNMSSEQIMELQEKLGYVSKGLSKQKIQSIKSHQYDEKVFENSDR